jgi:2-oxoglutarate dehydrogenase E1 component
VQEEPQNMGAWDYVAPLLRDLLPAEIALRYEGRGRRASTSEGYPQSHQAEQERLLAAALKGGNNA